jgi:hypothetical protein
LHEPTVLQRRQRLEVEEHEEVCKSCGFPRDEDECMPWDEDLMELSDCKAEFGDNICEVKFK